MISETARQLANGTLSCDDYLADLDPDRREAGDLWLLTDIFGFDTDTWTHGASAYKKGCYCDVCKDANAEANRGYRARKAAA